MTSTTKPDRLEYDARTGKFDDIWFSGADIHVEALGAGEFFIGIYRADGSIVALNANRARVAWTHEPTPPDASEEER